MASIFITAIVGLVCWLLGLLSAILWIQKSPYSPYVILYKVDLKFVEDKDKDKDEEKDD